MHGITVLAKGAALAMALASTFMLPSCQTAATGPAATSIAAPPVSQPTSVSVQSTNPPQAEPPKAVATAAPEILKLGVMGTLSGPTARSGMTSQRFITMGINDVNAKGGVRVGGKTYRLEASIVDDKFTSEGGREAANRLVLGERVKILIGPGSSPTSGAQPLTEPNKVLLISASASASIAGPSFPFTISIGVPIPAMRAPVLYDWLVKAYPQAKRVVVVATDDQTGRSNAAAAEAAAKDHGLTLVATELLPRELNDFNPAATRILRQNPDAIDLGSMASYVPMFLGTTKALWDQGYRKPMVGLSGSLEVFKAAPSILENYAFAAMADYKSSKVGDREKDVVERYIKAYGESELELLSLSQYNQPIVLAQAMEKAGAVDDNESIVKTMRDGEWDTIWGKQRFGGVKTFGLPVVLQQPIYLSKFEGGKLVTFEVFPGTLP